MIAIFLLLKKWKIQRVEEKKITDNHTTPETSTINILVYLFLIFLYVYFQKVVIVIQMFLYSAFFYLLNNVTNVINL